MKAIINKTMAIVASFCAIVSCEKFTHGNDNDESSQFDPRVDIVLTKSEEEILSANNTFAVNLFVAENVINEIKNKCFYTHILTSPPSRSNSIALTCNS